MSARSGSTTSVPASDTRPPHDPRPRLGPQYAAAWDRAAAEYQKQERLLLNPLLALMAYRLVTVVKQQRRLNATIVAERRFVYDNQCRVHGAERNDALSRHRSGRRTQTCREFVDRLAQLQRSAMVNRLRGEATSGRQSPSRAWHDGMSAHIPVLPPNTALTVAHAASYSAGALRWAHI